MYRTVCQILNTRSSFSSLSFSNLELVHFELVRVLLEQEGEQLLLWGLIRVILSEQDYFFVNKLERER